MLWSVAGLAALVAAWVSNETAREVLAKAFMSIAGVVSTPFILEATVALSGLVIVLCINRWRMEKEGDEWVYLAQTEPGKGDADTPPHRLESVVLEVPPAQLDGLNTRLSAIEGYVELGLLREALEQLDSLTPEENASAQAVELRAVTLARLG